MNMPKEIKQDIKELGYARLFGSRSMAARPTINGFDPAIMIGTCITEETDWDFSQQYSDDAHSYLLAAGFTHYSKADFGPYGDDLTVGVYIKDYTPKTDWGLSNIFTNVPTANIVLHSDEELFRRVWDAITPEFYYRYLWKRSPRFDHIDSLGKRKLHISEMMNQLFAVAKA